MSQWHIQEDADSIQKHAVTMDHPPSHVVTVPGGDTDGWPADGHDVVADHGDVLAAAAEGAGAAGAVEEAAAAGVAAASVGVV